MFMWWYKIWPFYLQVRAIGALANVVIASYLIGENILALVTYLHYSIIVVFQLPKSLTLAHATLLFADYNKCSCSCHVHTLIDRHHCSSFNESHILHLWVSGTCNFISLFLCVLVCAIYPTHTHVISWQLLLNCGFFVFLLHLLYAIFFTRLGLKASLRLPKWLEAAIWWNFL